MTTREFIANFKERTGRLPSQVELSRDLKISPQTALKDLIQYTREGAAEKKTVKIEEHKKDLVISLLKYLLASISVMAFILSVYFTGLWFMGRFHFIIAGMISLTMVMFMVIAPQASRYISKWPIKMALWLSFCIAMTFSMGSTIAGQYNKTTESAVQLIETTNEIKAYENIAVQEKELLQLIEDARKDKEVHQSSITLLSTTEEARIENWQSISTERKQLDKYNQKIDDLTASLKQLRDKKEISLDNGVQEVRVDFYSFVAGLTGKEVAFIEFLVSALPAIFIDIIAALCLNLALFIEESKK